MRPFRMSNTHTQHEKNRVAMSLSNKSNIKGTNAAAKDAGFDNFPAFLWSYGLRLESHDDVDEGKSILRGMDMVFKNDP
jgi:hypothetical protein